MARFARGGAILCGWVPGGGRVARVVKSASAVVLPESAGPQSRTTCGKKRGFKGFYLKYGLDCLVCAKFVDSHVGDRVLDGPASGGKGSKGRNELDCTRGKSANAVVLPENAAPHSRITCGQDHLRHITHRCFTRSHVTHNLLYTRLRGIILSSHAIILGGT